MGKKLSAYNLYMQKALKGKMAGKTKAQRKAIFKTAARGWNKGKPKSTSRSKPKSGGSSRSSSTTRRSNTTMGKKGGFNTQKLFKIVRWTALGAPAAAIALGPGTPKSKLEQGIMIYTSYDMVNKRFRPEKIVEGWGGYVLTSIVTKVIPKITGFIGSIL